MVWLSSLGGQAAPLSPAGGGGLVGGGGATPYPHPPPPSHHLSHHPQHHQSLGTHTLPHSHSIQQHHQQQQQHIPSYTVQRPLAYRENPYGRARVEYLRVPDRMRISLLPPSGGQDGGGPRYLSQQQQQQGGGLQTQQVPSGGQPPPPPEPPPFKKLRLGDQQQQAPQPHQQIIHHQMHPRLLTTDLQQQLRVDVKDNMAYGGNTGGNSEPLSPLMPWEVTRDLMLAEDQNFRATKDDLLHQISKVDADINANDLTLTLLRKSESVLEKVANKPPVDMEVESEVVLRHRSLAQKIYTDNRKKAQAAHSLLSTLGPPVQWPLYNQPLDTEVYHANKVRYLASRAKLLLFFRKRQAEKEARNTYLTETYSHLTADWQRKADKIECSQKRKAKEAKNREFFEKVFPELRKQREDKERFNRVGARVKSDADMEEIMDGLQEQELEDKKMRSYAVIPPIMYDSRQRKVVYTDNNGHCADMEVDYKEKQNLNIWTQNEKDIFKEKYLQHPKIFGVISSYLERKNVQDCVQYYYLSKKTENYKQLLKRSRQKPRSSRNPQKANNQTANIIDIMSSGVTTRQQQQKAGKDNKENQRQTNAEDSKVARDPLAISQKDLAMAAAKEKELSSSKDLNSSDISDSGVAKGFLTPVTICANNNYSSSNSDRVTSAPNDDSPNRHFVNLNNNSASPDPPMVVASNASLLNSPSNGLAVNSVYLGHSKQDTAATNKTSPTPPVAPDTTEDVLMQDLDKENKGDAALAENKKKTSRRKDSDEPMETSDDELQHKAPTPKLSTSSQEGSTTALPVTNAVSSLPSLAMNSNSVINSTNATTGSVVTTSNSTAPVVTYHPCCVCLAERCPSTRLLIRAQAHHYGLREDTLPAGAKVCKTCHCKFVRSRYTKCPLPSCPVPKIRAKRLRMFPSKWTELPPEVWKPIIEEYKIPLNVTKCCLACFKRISRSLAPHLEPSEILQDVESAFNEDEINKLKSLLQEHDTNWKTIANVLAKPINTIKRFYFSYKQKYNLDAAVSEFNKLKFSEDMKPVMSDEEESGSSTSSCDENMDMNNSDTASAESPNHPVTPIKSEVSETPSESILVGATSTTSFPLQESDEKSRILGMPVLPVTSSTILSHPPPGLIHPPSKVIVTKDEYDSSATETADEENESPTNRQSPKVLSINQTQSPYPSQATITVVPGGNSQHNGPIQNMPMSNPQRIDTSNSSLTVRDVMLNVIERSLKKASTGPSQQGNNGQKLNTTIVSQKNNDSRNDITFVREYRQEPVSNINKNIIGSSLAGHRQEPLATLSVVTSHGHAQQSMHQQPLFSPQMAANMAQSLAATITPVNQPAPPQQEMPKDGLVVVQLPQSEPQTLDLSIKKPRDQNFSGPPPPAHSKSLHSLHHNVPLGSGQSSIVTVFRTSDPNYINYQNSEQNRLSKSPLVYVSPVPISQQTHNISQIPSRAQNIQSPIQQPKISKTAPRLSPKMQTHGGPKGSITHGTPVNSSQPPPQMNSTNLGARFENMLRQTPPETKIGSITQGTPVHMSPYHLQDKRMYEFYGARNDKRQSPSGQPSSQSGSFSPYSQAQPSQSPAGSVSSSVSSGNSGTFTSPSPYGRPPLYGLDQKQIIMADYITSQQMHGSYHRRASQEQTPSRPTYISTRGSLAEHIVSSLSPQGSQSQQQQRREGVIQRHNTSAPSGSSGSGGPTAGSGGGGSGSQQQQQQTAQMPLPNLSQPPPQLPPKSASPHQRPMHHYPPPGHEAFSSLVDVAVQQPSLPVPHSLHKDPSGPDKPNHLQRHDPIRYQQERMQRNMALHQQQMQHQQQIQRHHQAALENQRRAHHQQAQAQQQAYQDRMDRDRQHQIDRDRMLQIERDREREQRDRQLQLERDKERQAAMERERQHQQHMQQLHDKEKQMQINRVAQNADEERLRRERDTRLLVNTFSTHPPAPTRLHERSIQPNRLSTSADGTLTAASLIDAIITHQINQTTSDTREPARPYLPYNSYHRDLSGGQELPPPPPAMQPKPSQQQTQPPSQQQQSQQQQSLQQNQGQQQQQQQQQAAQQRKAISPAVINMVEMDTSAAQQTKMITLGELTDSIIAKDFNTPSGLYGTPRFNPCNMSSRVQQQSNNSNSTSNSNVGNPPSGPGSVDVEWKRSSGISGSVGGRDVSMQQQSQQQQEDRHIIRQGPPKQNDSNDSMHHMNRMNQQDNRMNVPRRYAPPQAPPPPTQAPPPPSSTTQSSHHQPQHNMLNSAFEYVTHRIVEVMRTEDEGKQQRPVSNSAPDPATATSGTPPPPLTTYTYPYSALNVAGLVAPTGATTNPPDSVTADSTPRLPPQLPPQEPKPLMSAQYEPLSDED